MYWWAFPLLFYFDSVPERDKIRKIFFTRSVEPSFGAFAIMLSFHTAIILTP